MGAGWLAGSGGLCSFFWLVYFNSDGLLFRARLTSLSELFSKIWVFRVFWVPPTKTWGVSGDSVFDLGGPIIKLVFSKDIPPVFVGSEVSEKF